jgi:hypothetical protein
MQPSRPNPARGCSVVHIVGIYVNNTTANGHLIDSTYQHQFRREIMACSSTPLRLGSHDAGTNTPPLQVPGDRMTHESEVSSDKEVKIVQGIYILDAT